MNRHGFRIHLFEPDRYVRQAHQLLKEVHDDSRIIDKDMRYSIWKVANTHLFKVSDRLCAVVLERIKKNFQHGRNCKLGHTSTTDASIAHLAYFLVCKHTSAPNTDR
jgi:hypothetical protein